MAHSARKGFVPLPYLQENLPAGHGLLKVCMGLGVREVNDLEKTLLPSLGSSQSCFAEDRLLQGTVFKDIDV